MSRWGRGLAWLLVAVLLGGVAGCFGGTQNPSYFPYLLPTGDLIRTHAKPIGPGYYANFDPHAIDLALEPQVMTSQVGSQVIVLATVRDEKGVPRRNRRVEWKVTNGNLVEVDESGYLPGRGGVEGNTAFSFTSHNEHRLSRGNNNKADDVMLRPGQTWCVVSSPVEGDTHISAIVPAIFNWEKRIKTTVVRWVDATWEFPPRAVAKFGTEHEFVTRLARFTDRHPLAKYRVRYKILDGPAAMLLPSRAQEQVVISDLSGLAKVKIAQLAPASGINRVSVEIIRPPDPTTPSGAGVPIITGETSIEWLAPQVNLSHTGPASAALEQNIVYITSARNDGRIDSQWVELTLPLPDGLEFVGSEPATDPRGGQLIFPLPPLPVGQAHTIRTTFRTKRAGPVKSVALMRTAEGQTAQQEVNTLVTTPGLKVELLAPKTGIVDAPISYAIRVSNTGTGDIDEVQLVATYDVGLEHEQVKNPTNDPKLNTLMTKLPALKAGESRDEPLVLTPRRPGALGLKVTATGAGLTDTKSAIVTVQQPKMSLRVEGPAQRYVGRPAQWKIIIKNDSDAEQTGVMVRDRLPAEMRFVSASRNGAHAAGETVWMLGTLKAGEEATLDLVTECLRAAQPAIKTTLVTGDGNVRVERTSKIAIDPIAALNVGLVEENNPVEVGKPAVYRMTLTNSGSAPATKIDVKATLPPLLKATRADGPTKGAIAGQIVTFARFESLAPGATITFRFECQAVKEGDARFRVEYTSNLNEAPIIREAATRIVAPFGNPIPAPPGGGAAKPLPPG